MEEKKGNEGNTHTRTTCSQQFMLIVDALKDNLKEKGVKRKSWVAKKKKTGVNGRCVVMEFWVVLCCAVLCCVMLRCALLCCAVLCCIVLCCIDNKRDTNH